MTFNEELHLENKSVEERNNYYTQMIRNIEKYYHEHLLLDSSLSSPQLKMNKTNSKSSFFIIIF